MTRVRRSDIGDYGHAGAEILTAPIPGLRLPRAQRNSPAIDVPDNGLSSLVDVHVLDANVLAPAVSEPP